MNQLSQIFMYEGAQVRTVVIDDQPWFVLRDLCDVLEISHAPALKQRLSDDVVSNYPMPDSLGRMQDTTIVNEDGMYDVILESRKKEARTFRRWVTGDVLPTIRKTGSYNTQPQYILPTFAEALEGYAAQLRISEALDAQNKQLALESAEQKQKLKEQEAPVAIYNLAISAKNAMSMQEVAKALGTGRNRLYDILREEGIIMKGSTMPFQRYLDSGHFKVTERPRTSGDTIVNDPATRVYAKGFDYIARLLQKRAAQEERARKLVEEAAEQSLKYNTEPILQ
ncbi:anti-repressor protein [Paenibacillus sp. V4I3]|uniref:phage antirepressor n=1 Tax=Paenibacillus sp. V4I3 TaxID=3042305 RepID=UPI002782378B|nr:phage antirepressor [Paenibacillus sp. V4I3]MDQ0873754.1 anti-repressor protein [Paenibacillus sp. V4I3]